MGSLSLIGHRAQEVFLGYELGEEVLGLIVLGLLEGCVAEQTFKSLKLQSLNQLERSVSLI